MSFKASIKSLLVAINISPENTVCSKILSVVAQSLEFDNDNCFYDALDFLIPSIPQLFRLFLIAYSVPRNIHACSIQRTWPEE